MDKFGLAEPIITQPDGTVIGGHARLQILETSRSEKTKIDVYVPERQLTEKEYKELNVRLNRNIAGEFDYNILAAEFEFDELIGYGFDDKELSKDAEFTNEFDSYDNDNCDYPIVPEYSEKHDAIMIVSENEIDTVHVLELLNLGKMKSYKNNTRGQSYVIDIKEFIKLWKIAK